jgi:hypothetical protein
MLNLRKEADVTPAKACCLGIALLLCFALPGFSLSQQGKKEPKPAYESLLERVKKQDSTVDFTALRMAYFDSPKHKWTDSELRSAMFKALGEKNYDKAIETAGKILNENYLDIDAQSLVPLDGHHYDVMKVVSSEGGQQSTVYFNIDRPHAEEMKMFQ